MVRILISAKQIIKQYRVPYQRINYLTKKGVFKVVARSGNKRLYSLEEIEERLGGKKGG